MAKKLGFGFMRLPLLDQNDQTSFDYPKIEEMVDAFIENGFTYFDTAHVYHGGLSEEALRKTVVERYDRDRFTIATKMLPRVLQKAEDMENIFAGQLKRCGVEFFDYYLVHNIVESSYAKAQQFGTFEFLAQKRDEGKIKKLGMSFHGTPELLDEVLTAHPGLDFVQLQINYIDWENPVIQSRRCYEVARKHRLPIVVMEPCKGGNLACVPKEAEALMKGYHPDLSVSSWAIRFAASREGVFMVLSGMNSMEQMLDNVSYMGDFHPITGPEQEILDRVAGIIDSNTAVGCTACRYCEAGCPKQIAIPDYFNLYNNVKRSAVGGIQSQFVYYQNLTAAHGKPEDCIGCGKCESACPQHLEIPKHLKEVSALFSSMA